MIVPEDLWEEFRKHRKKIRAPMTEYAEKLILGKLEVFKKNGGDPVAIVNESIERGWAGVFMNGQKEKTAGSSTVVKACRECKTTNWTSLDAHGVCSRCCEAFKPFANILKVVK